MIEHHVALSYFINVEYFSSFFFKDVFISLAADGNISVNITIHLDTLKLTYPPHVNLHGDSFNVRLKL